MPTPTLSDGKSWYLVNTDQLTQLVLDLIPSLSPEIRQDTNRMADLIREMVDFEREKSGLTQKPQSGGIATLYPSKNRQSEQAPHFVGQARIDGKRYSVALWTRHGAEFINLTFSPM